ncbi:MAG: hypothetical protein AB7S26_20110 [Sandaracinaceae bacterium]
MQATIDKPLIERWNAPPPPPAPVREDDHDEPPPPAAARAAVPTPIEPAEPRIRAGWAAYLLSDDASTRSLVRRAAMGIGLASLYGVALGARAGGWALGIHALGVPAAIVAVTALGLPALYILLALFDTPLSIRAMGLAAVRGIASAGLLLAGLAPLTALYVVTSASTDGARVAGIVGLVIGGGLGLHHLMRALSNALSGADSATRGLAFVAQVGFAFFALLLACRVWGGLLPLIGGGA